MAGLTKIILGLLLIAVVGFSIFTVFFLKDDAQKTVTIKDVNGGQIEVPLKEVGSVYDETENSVTISIADKEVSKVRLLSPKNVFVMRGLDRKVAEFEIESYEELVNFFTDMEFYTGSRLDTKINRQFTYKYRVIEVYDSIPEYTNECFTDDKNNSNQICSQKTVNTTLVPRYAWIPLESEKKVTLPKGSIVIGVFTDVLPNDHVEWIPTFLGNVKVTQWATWTDSMTVGLQDYWKLDETTGNNAQDSVLSKNNGTNGGTWATGKINNGVLLSDQAVEIKNENSFDDLFNGSNSWSISMWINTTDTGWNSGLMTKGYAMSSEDFVSILGGGNDEVMCYMGVAPFGATGEYQWKSDTHVAESKKWVHVVVVYYGLQNATSCEIWVNGTNRPLSTPEAHPLTETLGNDQVLTFGAGFGKNTWNWSGNLDEIGVWNRTLSPTEISNLYNSGSGLSYPLLSTVTLISPVNKYNSSLNYITFNCSLTNTEGQLYNLTLVKDHTDIYTIKNSTSNDYQLNLSKQVTMIDFGYHNWTCRGTSVLVSTPITASQWDFNITVDSPRITLLNPANNTNSSSSSVNFNCSSLDATALLNTTLMINGIYNYTVFNTTTTYSLNVSRTVDNFADGLYNWTCTSSNSANLRGVGVNASLRIDTTAPFVNITAPLNNSYIYNYTAISIYSNATITEGYLKNCWFNTNFNGTNTSFTCNTKFQIPLGVTGGNHTLRVYANDTVGNIGLSQIQFYVNYYIDQTWYDSPYSSGDPMFFQFNLTSTQMNKIAVNMTYNNTLYSMTIDKSNSTFISTSRTLYAPVVTVPTDIDFVFNYQLNDVNFTSSTLSTEIFQLNSLLVDDNCSPNSEAIYFTLTNEDNQSDIIGTFNYNFLYGTEFNGTISRMYGTVSNATFFYLCANYTTSNFSIDTGEIQYSSTGYVNRRYYIFNQTRFTSSSTLMLINLTDLLTANADAFEFTVQDNQYNVKSNYYVVLLRWYPGLNQYRIVEISKTDDKGKTVASVRTEDTDYRIGVYDTKGLLVNLFTPIRFVCTATPCTYNIFLPSSNGQYYDIGGIQQNLYFEKAAKIFHYVWNDVGMATNSMNLSVYKESGSSSNLVCSSQGTGFTGIINCNVSTYTGNLRAIVVRNASPEHPIASLLVTIGTVLSDIAGGKTIGLLMSLILFVFAFLVGIYSPIVAIFLGVIALVPALFFGAITQTLFIGVILLGWLVIHFIRRS